MYAMNISHLNSLSKRLHNDSNLIFKDTVKEAAIFPICKKIYRNTGGSEKTCFQQQQN